MSPRMRAWLAWVVLLGATRLGVADGGVPILVSTAEGRTWTLMMRPARPSVGPIELDLLGSTGTPARLELREQDGPWQALSFEAGTDARVVHARTELESAGSCAFRLWVPGVDTPFEAGVEVSERPAGTFTQWPWACAWIPMVLLLWLRSRAIRARLYTAPHG